MFSASFARLAPRWLPRHRSRPMDIPPSSAPPRSWSCGWHENIRDGHKGNHNSKIAEDGTGAVIPARSRMDNRDVTVCVDGQA
jgi:hypothetical protein